MAMGARLTYTSRRPALPGQRLGGRLLLRVRAPLGVLPGERRGNRMFRRFVIALSVVGMLGALGVTQAGAKPGVVHSKRVCGVSYSSRVAQCFARVVTDAKGRPMAVRPNLGTPPFGPADLHAGYSLPTTVIGT